MIVRWPGRVPPGTVSDYVTAHWDSLPTAAALAVVPAPADLDGQSIVPQMTSSSRDGARPTGLYWELRNRDESGVGLRGQAARIRDWKAVRPERGAPIELYDLGTDPAETRNLVSARPEVLSELEQFMKHRIVHRARRKRTLLSTAAAITERGG